MKIVLIGAGNVVSHLASTLYNKNVTILQIFSRSLANAQVLAEKVQASYTDDIKKLNREADMYIFSVKDDLIESLLQKAELPKSALFVHTAGSVNINIFNGYAKNFGVIYPLQSFSKKSMLAIDDIPIFIESNSRKAEEGILEIAEKLSENVRFANSEQRLKIHLAAVFACNFTNHMYAVASDLLEEAGQSFDIMLPLIETTFEKIKIMSPYDAQTGPAVRFDKKTEEKHILSLTKKTNLQKIYKDITSNIHTMYSK